MRYPDQKISPLVLIGLSATLFQDAAADPVAAPALADEIQAISPMYKAAVAGLPEPRLVLDSSGLPHVIFYETVNTRAVNRLEFILRYTYLDGTIVRSFPIPSSGVFTTTCVLQTGGVCTPHLAAPEIVMDSQKRAHIVAQGSDAYDQTTNTSTAQIVSVTCAAGVACNAPVQVAIFNGLCDLGIPRTKCPPPPPKSNLQIFNDQLYVRYSTSMDYHVESTVIHWVTATRSVSGGSFSTVFQFDSKVMDTLLNNDP